MKSIVIRLCVFSVISGGLFAASLTQNMKPKHQSAVIRLLAPAPVLQHEKKVTVSANVKSVPSVRKLILVREVNAENPIVSKKVALIPVPAKPKLLSVVPVEDKTNVQRLLDIIDKMTPTQAMAFQTKLASRIFQPVPENFIKNLDIKMSGSFLIASLSDFNNKYSATFGKMGMLLGTKVGASFPLAEDIRFGLEYSSGRDSMSKKTDATVYEDLSINYSGVSGYLQWNLIQQKSFQLSTEVSVGYIAGGFAYSKVDEQSSSSNLQTIRQGGTLFTRVGLTTTWEINPVWSCGMGISYQLANITDLKRGEISDATAPALDLSGVEFKVINTLSL